MKWLGRAEWREAFSEALDRHLLPACKRAGVEITELPEILDDDLLTNLSGCAFEDFLTVEDERGRNIVDDFLKRRGWKESASDRRYMTGLRNSVMSLYEVSNILPGVSFLARDLVRGGEPVLVSEHTATKSLKSWDRIGARLVNMGGKTIMGGGVLAFDYSVSEELLTSLKSVSARISGGREKLASDAGVAPDHPAVEEAISDNALLRSAAIMFSTRWLTDALRKTMDPVSPSVSNSDGEDLVFTEIRFPLAAKITTTAVRRAVDALPELRRASPTVWNWLREGGDRPRKPDKPKGEPRWTFVSTMDDGAIVLGTIEIKGRYVTLTTNSVERGRRGEELLTSALRGLVLEPVAKEQSLEEIRKSPRKKPTSKPTELPPDEARRLVHAALEQHYRKQLDEPVPVLGDISPRKAARTSAGREKVVTWLKTLENHSGRVGKDDPIATFDFGWMWKELGVDDQRR